MSFGLDVSVVTLKKPAATPAKPSAKPPVAKPLGKFVRHVFGEAGEPHYQTLMRHPSFLSSGANGYLASILLTGREPDYGEFIGSAFRTPVDMAPKKPAHPSLDDVIEAFGNLARPLDARRIAQQGEMSAFVVSDQSARALQALKQLAATAPQKHPHFYNPGFRALVKDMDLPHLYWALSLHLGEKDVSRYVRGGSENLTALLSSAFAKGILSFIMAKPRSLATVKADFRDEMAKEIEQPGERFKRILGQRSI